MGGTQADENFETVCNLLDYNSDNGLVCDASEARGEYQKHAFMDLRKKLGIDGVFFLKTDAQATDVPIILFKKYQSRNTDEIAYLHNLVWNSGNTPLLFIILPDSFLVLNGFKPLGASQDLNRELLDVIIDDFELTHKALQLANKYHRSKIQSGYYWQENRKSFDKGTTVQEMLIKNIDCMRKRLIERPMPPEIVNGLLLRSILIKYLEDRRDKDGHNVFPADFFGRYVPSATTFTDVLVNKDATYSLFKDLSEKFNGDIFKLSPREEETVKPADLKILRYLLEGDKDLEFSRMVLWKQYAFDVIPIELISNIYEHIFNSENLREGKKKEDDKKDGTFYTPHHLVTFLLDEVLPWEGRDHIRKILDPSCGSGIFLVEAYRRLIFRKAKTRARPLNFAELSNILKSSIFGVDKNREAIRIATFSLYLTLCDHMEPRPIWDSVRFPALLDENLFGGDFFDPSSKFNNMSFDLIIGNAPWQSKLTPLAEQYREAKRCVIGDDQISQLFLLKAIEVCKASGEILLIVASKPLLFNQSSPNKEFREGLFNNYNVKSIINFSALRHILWADGEGAGSAIRLSLNPPDEGPIIYCCPKPSYTPQDYLTIFIEPHDLNMIPKDEAKGFGSIWKTAMWGSPRDYELIKKLSPLPSLGRICEQEGWTYGEGYIRGNRSKESLEHFGKPQVDSKSMRNFYLEASKLPSCPDNRFERVRTEKKEIFVGPHIVVKQSPTAGAGRLAAALIEDDAVFTHAFMGIHGEAKDVGKLSTCCLALNTNIPYYYQMMTGGAWLIERDLFEQIELLSTPMPWDAVSHLDPGILKEMASKGSAEAQFEQINRDSYGLEPSDLYLIDDAINITLDLFNKKEKSKALLPPLIEEMEDYCRVFLSSVNNSLSSEEEAFNARLYEQNGPLRLVSFVISEKSKETNIDMVPGKEPLDRVLEQLDKDLLEERSSSVFLRRHLIRYDSDSVSIVKPNQKRYWTKSMALRDADVVVADILLSGGVKHKP